MNNDFDSKISRGLAKMVSPDAFDKITEKLPSVSSEERTTTTMKKTNKIIRFLLPAVAACLIIAAGVFGVNYYNGNIRVDSIIDIDVNPGIELSTNAKDRVIDVTAVNSDATDILDGMDLKDTDLKVAVNAIIGSMVQKGYVTDEMSSILVTVKNKDSGKADTLRTEIVKNIDATLLSKGINAPVINQTVTDSDDVEAFAKKHGISFGKALFVKNIAGKDVSLNADELAKLSISELTDVVIKNNIDISDIADYDHDDSIWENIHESIDEVDEEKAENEYINNNVEQGDAITEEQAKAIAFNHAGVSESDVRGLKIEKDYDDGVEQYEIDFSSGNYEYEYDINANNGNILKSDKEYDD